MRIAIQRCLSLAAVTVALFASASSRADVLGFAYLNSSASMNAVIGFAHGSPDAVFSVPSAPNGVCSGGLTLCFQSQDSTIDTLGHFLASGGAAIISATPAALAGGLNNTGFEFTGYVTVVTGQTFEAGHDDGIQFKIGNTLVIDAPKPTPLLFSPAVYTGPSGTFAFDLVYANCCGGPAILLTTLPDSSLSDVQAVPEPGSILLVGGGLLAVAVRRRMTAADQVVHRRRTGEFGLLRLPMKNRHSGGSVWLGLD